MDWRDLRFSQGPVGAGGGLSLFDRSGKVGAAAVQNRRLRRRSGRPCG